MQALGVLGLDTRVALRNAGTGVGERAGEDGLLAAVLSGVVGIISEPIRYGFQSQTKQPHVLHTSLQAGRMGAIYVHYSSSCAAGSCILLLIFFAGGQMKLESWACFGELVEGLWAHSFAPSQASWTHRIALQIQYVWLSWAQDMPQSGFARPVMFQRTTRCRHMTGLRYVFLDNESVSFRK
jgi:hypothetical protein